MKKEYGFLLVLTLLTLPLTAQTFSLKKGAIIDALPVHDSVPDTYSLYLPTNFNTEQNWPILFVFDLNGQNKKALSLFVNVAEEEGYLLASPNGLADTLSLSKNVLRTGRTMAAVNNLLPVDKSRIYVAGLSNSGRYANTVPLFIKGISGVVSFGASLPNTELLTSKNPFHFIGIVSREDYVYTDLLRSKKVLNGLKFNNQLLIFDGKRDLPDAKHLRQAFRLFKLNKIARGELAEHVSIINESYTRDIAEVKQLISENKLILADNKMGELLSVYRLHRPIDSLKLAKRDLKKQKLYRSMKRAENAAFFQESLLRDDYQFYLEEDVLTYNFNNLGWWNYQMGELQKFINGSDVFKKRMGHRMKSYINALIDDSIDVVNAEKMVDEDALIFLSMLKTIVEPNGYGPYLKVISLSAKNEDFGTALFYLEELLKKGFKDRGKLYAIEHTALFRISPEFNKVVSKYLKDARYDVIEE